MPFVFGCTCTGVTCAISLLNVEGRRLLCFCGMYVYMSVVVLFRQVLLCVFFGAHCAKSSFYVVLPIYTLRLQHAHTHTYIG